MKKKTEAKFKLLRISTEEFAILEPIHPREEMLEFNLKIHFAISDQDEQIACITVIELSTKLKSILKLKNIVEFEVKPDDWQNFRNKNKIIIPKDLLAHLAMISVGTTRGVLHSKTEKTDYQLFTLPLIDVVDLIKEDEVVEI
ncbi:hypothetical protein [Elizabethkingia anophelis]|uniref:hypothetical protein n=1 Tax=Elizabethkingia anophelis TaxID=1117645 RepID=UPI00075138D7|nr:hypothetical protein [Elizabethkingia anophelis]AQW90040.1 hypothetical protein BBD28_04910 [Elizabethkingia anophelis]KUY21665.1 hypothetical protein ATB94_18050 [Elizabethkingia anophelis]